jgi:hypothetical protein
MIFDGFENDEDLFRAMPAKQAPLPDCDISLDCLILARQEREANKDFSHCYETLQMQVQLPARKFRVDDKENCEYNISSNQKRSWREASKEWPGRKVSGCGEGTGRGGRGGSQSPVRVNLASQYSLAIDIEKVNISFKPSLAILAALESDESVEEASPDKRSLEELLGNPKTKFTSPVPKRGSPTLLKKRPSMNEYPKDSPRPRRQSPKVGKEGLGLANIGGTSSKCCRFLFKDPRLSMQDIHLQGGKPHKRQPVKRSFSVNSIAREIFKASQVPENPSFHSIHSMDYIGTSNIDLDDCLESPCGVCDRPFRPKDLVAKTYACQHVFHKQCLDGRLFELMMEEQVAICPTCQQPV